MTRYFFDVNARGSLRYDFTGCWLTKPDQAQEMAELIAMDLACLEVDQSFPTEVQVRDAAGQQLFSVPVQRTETVAA
jgi:hypothetical protein